MAKEEIWNVLRARYTSGLRQPFAGRLGSVLEHTFRLSKD
jgi:hypothetical protein